MYKKHHFHGLLIERFSTFLGRGEKGVKRRKSKLKKAKTVQTDFQREHEVPIYLFKQGNNFEAQRFFGAHFETRGETTGVCFRVWARVRNLSVSSAI